MSRLAQKPTPADQAERNRALDPGRSMLVQAPAGSGKTDLLTRRFLRLLAEVDEPGQIVAITFTIAAAAEMRHRILAELEKAAGGDDPIDDADGFSMQSLARRALEHSRQLEWKLLDLPGQLRISTIDSFCRDLALQQPLLSSLGGGIGIAEQPSELYRRAARQTLEKIGGADGLLSGAIEALLLWRDNNWQEMEDLLVEMLGKRDRWMHDFVLDRGPDQDDLRASFERPFANAVRDGLARLDGLLDQVPGCREEALALARFGCEQTGGQLHRKLAELAEFPGAPFLSSDALEEGRETYLSLAQLLLTGGGSFRKAVDKRLGFPVDRKGEKARILGLIARLNAVDGLEAALAGVRDLPPARYTEEDWQIVRACFTLLRHAAGELQVVFAEAAAVDFIEVAQIAQRVLRGEDGLPTDAALAVADGIRHMLVDEFQDTSRRQHQMLASLIGAWPDRDGRTCFLVGDPMQSIYFFRDADAELFARVKEFGLEIPEADPLVFDFVPLTANFRTTPSLVNRLNDVFHHVFAVNDGSGVSYSSAEPARDAGPGGASRFKLHMNFSPQIGWGKTSDSEAASQKEEAHRAQTEQIVELIKSRQKEIKQACANAVENGSGEKYRIAVLGRTRAALAPIAVALREAAIPFRAVDLEKLENRPEILDALALARALLNPEDRVAWLGVLRAPWCGLSLKDLHLLTSADDSQMLACPVPELLAVRMQLLSEEGREAVRRVMDAVDFGRRIWTGQPAASPGTWLEQIWLRLGGADCVDETGRANVDLLWSCLDSLPGGEQDLLGPGLDSALEKLAALPDPAAGSDFGVQLMTIHKSKGLEFEVVIVPDLQARDGNSGRKLLGWLERGTLNADEAGRGGEITEFLVAPLQTKGADRGGSKAWVDHIYREREKQEMRRIFYVASTRAREELHLFARPDYKVEADGSLALAEPTGSLLATAWPSLEEEVCGLFEDWKAERAGATSAGEQVLASIAAVGEDKLLVMPSTVKPTLLRRLPVGYEAGGRSVGLLSGESAESQTAMTLSEAGASRLYARHEGGLLSRALGTAVHALLEDLSRLRADLDWEAARKALKGFEPRIAAGIRAAGVNQAHATEMAEEALELALGASLSAEGDWILSPHAEAENEVRWAGVVAGGLRTVRVDRVFRAGLEPLSEGQEAWWIIDYKSANAGNLEEAVVELRRLFAPQIEAYGKMLRNLHGPDAILRAGLFYPRMLLLDWWEF